MLDSTPNSQKDRATENVSEHRSTKQKGHMLDEHRRRYFREGIPVLKKQSDPLTRDQKRRKMKACQQSCCRLREVVSCVGLKSSKR